MAEKSKGFINRSTDKLQHIEWKSPRTRRILIITGVVILLIVGAGAGYSVFRQKQTAVTTNSSSGVQTAVARMGSITIDASGSGTLVGGNSTSLAFPIAGIVKEVLVQVGEQVKKGQPLADLADTQSRRRPVCCPKSQGRPSGDRAR
jgi:multidrug efflux pump subunit AcrA (membrane-fusion protein)